MGLRPTHVIASPILALVVTIALCALLPARASEAQGDAASFARAVPLPHWAGKVAAPPVPAALRARPSVLRLWEQQFHVGPPGSESTRLTRRVVQVQHSSALGEIGQVAIEFNPPFERVQLHRLEIERDGRTIDHVVGAPLRLMQREARLEQGLYSGMVTAVLVLPAVRVGDTLHLAYSVVGEAPTRRERYSRIVVWDQPVAVALRRVVLHAPLAHTPAWRWLGSAGAVPQERLDAGWRRLVFEARELPAATAEPAMPTHAWAQRRLQFSAYEDWHAVARWSSALFAADAALPASLAPVMAALRKQADPAQRAAAALRWVQEEIRPWSQVTGDAAVRPQAPAAVLARGWGDCKDKSLLLATMLRALGLDAQPALVSVAAPRAPPLMLPTPDAFDHVIVRLRLNGRDHWLDATRQGQAGALAQLGQAHEDAAVLPIDAATIALETVRSPNRDEIFDYRLHEHLSVGPDGDGSLATEVQWSGLEAEQLRRLLVDASPGARRRLALDDYATQYPGVRLLAEPEFDDDPSANRIVLRARFVVPALARRAGELWAVPFAPSLGDLLTAPLNEARRFPLRLSAYPTTYRYVVTVDWPEGLVVTAGPADGAAAPPLRTPQLSFESTRNAAARREERHMRLTVTAAEVAPGETAAFAADLAAVVARIGGVLLATGADQGSAGSVK